MKTSLRHRLRPPLAPIQRSPSRSSKMQRTPSLSSGFSSAEVTKRLPWSRAMPLLVPAQRLPSRSAHKARTEGSGNPSRRPYFWMAPVAERRIIPRLPAIQILPSRSAVLVTAQIPPSHHPQRAFPVGEQGSDRRIRQTLFHGERAESALAILRQAVGGADPQTAVVGRGQRGDGVIRQIAIGLVVDHELIAVEARQTLVGAQPQVAVRGLRD